MSKSTKLMLNSSALVNRPADVDKEIHLSHYLEVVTTITMLAVLRTVNIVSGFRNFESFREVQIEICLDAS